MIGQRWKPFAAWASIFTVPANAPQAAFARQLPQRYKRTMMPTPGLIFSGIMLPLLALCYYCGVIPLLHSREYAVRRADDPRRFNVTAGGLLAILIFLPFLWR